ncbi:RNA polymerase sigma factor [Achromobacter denitrificans]|uniref:RNA polymerase sigma factor n=1 Tax=Achromobacter denitrificans TaxID=32002 RepID=UPI00311A0D0F|nr:sigma-70 family RNA polymerase sigma factor [Achromobacter denitrificans]
MSAMTTWHGVDLRWAYADLLGGIQRRTGCVHRAHDVLHDSLVRMALVRRDTPIPCPHAYLRVVVGNVIADRFKDEARWVELPDEEGTGVVLECAPSAEHVAELNQRLRFMQTILDCLPPRCREVFWFFCVEGYTQPEIAARLGISLKIVERHVARAMLDIRAARQEMLA